MTGTDAAGKPLTPDVRKSGTSILFTGAPGTYQVTLLVVDFDAKSLDEAEATVTMGGNGPVPVPPGPIPPAPVTPPAGLTLAQALAVLDARTAATVTRNPWLGPRDVALLTQAGHLYDAALQAAWPAGADVGWRLV